MNASVDKRSINRLLRGSLMRSLTNEPFIMSRLLAGWQECISAAAGTGMMDNLEEYERMPSSGSWRTPERENLCACAVAGWKISGFFLLFFFTMLLLLTFCANGGGGGKCAVMSGDRLWRMDPFGLEKYQRTQSLCKATLKSAKTKTVSQIEYSRNTAKVNVTFAPHTEAQAHSDEQQPS